jgi:hypothetical protein
MNANSHFKLMAGMAAALLCASSLVSPAASAAPKGKAGAAKSRPSSKPQASGASRDRPTRSTNNTHDVRRDANTNINYNSNKNRNVNIDRDVNVDVDIDRRGGWYDDHHQWHPVAAVATAAVIGSVIYSLPPNCSTVYVNGITYTQCGSSWYQPRYYGNSVQYVVITAPR